MATTAYLEHKVKGWYLIKAQREKCEKDKFYVYFMPDDIKQDIIKAYRKFDY